MDSGLRPSAGPGMTAERSLDRRRTRTLLGRLIGRLGLQRRDARLQGLVLLARQAGHFLDRLEFLALDHVEVAQDALGLGPEQSVEFAPHPLRDPGGIVHQARHLVKNAVAGLGHGLPPARFLTTMAIRSSGCKTRHATT